MKAGAVQRVMAAIDVATDRNYRMDPGELAIDVIDLLADVMHLCHARGLQFETLRNKAEFNVDEERDEQPPVEFDVMVEGVFTHEGLAPLDALDAAIEHRTTHPNDGPVAVLVSLPEQP